MTPIEEIDTLLDQEVELNKQIKQIEMRIRKIRQACDHKYEHTNTFGDGDWEYTCTKCGHQYVH